MCVNWTTTDHPKAYRFILKQILHGLFRTVVVVCSKGTLWHFKPKHWPRACIVAIRQTYKQWPPAPVQVDSCLPYISPHNAKSHRSGRSIFTLVLHVTLLLFIEVNVGYTFMSYWDTVSHWRGGSVFWLNVHKYPCTFAPSMKN